jgi:hypothetical protein
VSQLEFIKPEQATHPNVLIYGAPKTGKTTGACSAAGGVLLLNLDLPNASKFAHDRDPEGRIMEVRWQGMKTLIAVSNAIAQQTDQGQVVETVVIDTIGELHRRLIEEASDRAIRPTLNQYGDTSVHIERFCRYLCEQPVNVVIVCHEIPTKDEATGTIERLPFTGTSNPTLGQKLMAMVDVVGYTGVIEREDGSHDYVAQLINDRGRRGGDRFDVLGDWRTLNLAEWFALIHDPTPPAQQEAVAA